MTEPTTVLQVRNSVAFGGVETTMLGWLSHIDKQRFRCPVALFSNRDRCEDAFRIPLQQHDLEILDLPWWPGRQFFKAINRLVELIRATDAKLLHTHDWRSDIIGYYAAKKAGIPIITTVYVWFKRPLKIRISEMIDAWRIRKFDLVTGICEATRQQCVDRGVKASKTRVLISGISDDRYRPDVDRDAVRRRFGIAPEDLAFVYTARFYLEKAHLCLIDAVAQAIKTCPNLRVLLLGSGPLENKIRQRARQLGVDDAVIMPGFVDDVPEVLRAMDVMVHASLAEGIPLAVYEGMLAGLPVIGSNVDGTPEVVIPGQTGWRVPPNDPHALGQRIVEAAESGEIRDKLGRQARQLILERYNIAAAIDRLEGTYDEMLGRKAGEDAAGT